MQFQYLMTLNIMLFTYKKEQKTTTCRTVVYLDNNQVFYQKHINLFLQSLINADNLGC